MSKSVLAMNTPKNCYDCPFGTAYCGELEYVGYCELADCLDCDEILITEEHYDCESKSRPDWCPLKPLPEKMKVTGIYNYAYLEAGGKPPSYKIGWNDCIDAIAEASDEKTLYEASEVLKDEEKIKDAISLVRTFAKSPDRTALTDAFIESLKLLTDTVESQMGEVK